MIDPLEHFIYRLRNAVLRPYPFTHLWIDDVFPDWYYGFIRDNLSGASVFEQMAEYPHRLFSGELADEVKALFASPRLGAAVCKKFGLKGVYDAMIRWTRDSRGYLLEPHTDAREKVLTLLFYTPDPRNAGPWGTSFYLPKDQKLQSDGTEHCRREDFNLIYTVPFKANSMLGILRSDFSWHGVEPIVKDIQRDSLFYTLMVRS